MHTAEVLADAYGRIRECVHGVVDGLSQEELDRRPAPAANTIAWLIWHLARVQDDHLADASGRPQVWTAQGWAERFRLPLDARDIGYGHTTEQAGLVRGVPGADLLGYYDAVHAQTLDIVHGLSAPDLDRIVDASWDPPVTLGVRLVSVVSDDLQHAGQAAYVRGLLRSG
ncbi:mycothiol transferase [Marinactinospora rubrisoli]|uniref:DUF664 domain-containing protein n=1 Tax=Marinactinospora rubrisoli TaxID=2715399 RepID=A0ABW2KGN9_9ACTN